MVRMLAEAQGYKSFKWAHSSSRYPRGLTRRRRSTAIDSGSVAGGASNHRNLPSDKLCNGVRERHVVDCGHRGLRRSRLGRSERLQKDSRCRRALQFVNFFCNFLLETTVVLQSFMNFLRDWGSEIMCQVCMICCDVAETNISKSPQFYRVAVVHAHVTSS